MNKVVTINLNGRAYQLEEAGYAELKSYLGQAEHSLVGNPDREEIVADFEQAIADKCDQMLSSVKSVVSQSEIASIIQQMGPVNVDDKILADNVAQAPPKRFYLIKEGSIIGGVCTGLAAYFNMDVTVVRLLVVLVSFMTSGAGLAAYIVVMLVAPQAVTPEQKAQARGKGFNSQELLATARQKYAFVGDKAHWQQVATDMEPSLSRFGAGIRRGLRLVGAIIAGLGVAALLGLAVVGFSSVWSIMFSGQLFGLGLDPSVSTSLAALFVASGLLVGATPILIITIAAYKYAKHGSLRQSIWGLVATLAVFAVALATCLAIVSTTPQIRDAGSFHVTLTPHHRQILCLGVCQ
jgi:phage shock protein PspC (stress-responsive transcriptional regulator)